MAAEQSPFGRRVVVMGRGGKTSLARALGDRLSLPFLELDSVTWLPNWELRDRAERRRVVAQWMANQPDGWVIDGDSQDPSGAELTDFADCVIWLDLPFPTAFWRIMKRTVRRVRSGEKVCGENYETWCNAVFSTDSLVLHYPLWFLNGRWRRQKRRLLELISGLRDEQSGFRIHSARELDEFYAAHGMVPPAG